MEEDSPWEDPRSKALPFAQHEELIDTRKHHREMEGCAGGFPMIWCGANVDASL